MADIQEGLANAARVLGLTTVGRPKIEMPKYDGQEDPDEWLRDWDDFVQIQGYSAANAFAMMQFYLTGVAQEVWRTYRHQCETASPVVQPDDATFRALLSSELRSPADLGRLIAYVEGDQMRMTTGRPDNNDVRKFYRRFMSAVSKSQEARKALQTGPMTDPTKMRLFVKNLTVRIRDQVMRAIDIYHANTTLEMAKDIAFRQGDADVIKDKQRNDFNERKNDNTIVATVSQTVDQKLDERINGIQAVLAASIEQAHEQNMRRMRHTRRRSPSPRRDYHNKKVKTERHRDRQPRHDRGRKKSRDLQEGPCPYCGKNHGFYRCDTTCCRCGGDTHDRYGYERCRDRHIQVRCSSCQKRGHAGRSCFVGRNSTARGYERRESSTRTEERPQDVAAVSHAYSREDDDRLNKRIQGHMAAFQKLIDQKNLP